MCNDKTELCPGVDTTRAASELIALELAIIEEALLLLSLGHTRIYNYKPIGRDSIKEPPPTAALSPRDIILIIITGGLINFVHFNK